MLIDELMKYLNQKQDKRINFRTPDEEIKVELNSLPLKVEKKLEIKI